MYKNQKLIIGFAAALNIVLAVVLIMTVNKINFVKEQIILTEIRDNLVELEGLIANQLERNWYEPNLVTTELGDVMNGFWLGTRSGEQLGVLSENDMNILNSLSYKLNQYPQDKLYSFVELSAEDKENFEELRNYLRVVGLGLNLQISNDFNSFMDQAQLLETKIKIPLD